MLTTQRPQASPMVPSSQRPVPLRRREDLVVRRILYRGVGFPVVKDPCGLKYYRLQPEQFAVLELLDGERNLEQIRDALQRDYPTIPITLADVQTLVTDLHEKGLLISERPGQGIALLRARRERKLKKLRQTLLNPLYMKLPGVDPDRWLAVMDRFLGWMFRWWFTVPVLTFVLFSYLFLAVRFDDLMQRLPEFQQFFGWPNLIYLWITLACVKVLHEFGHGLACKHFGGECHAMGIMLLVFSPTMYCDVTDSWMLPNKWKRIFIAAAGMYVEIVLASAMIFVWWNTEPGVLHHLALNVFFVSTVTTVIFNANPLLRFDGYYMLSDLLEIPNLRPKASRVLQQTFAWRCLGIELKSDPFLPTSGRIWFVLFIIASSIYRWVVMFGIVLFLYTVLKPYRLEAIGITMAVVSIGTMLFHQGRSLHQLLTMPRADPLSRRKMAVSLGVLGALVGAILFVPFPWYLEAPFTIEPVNVHHVYTQVPGTLGRVHVAEGDRVSEGDLLAELDNLELAQTVRDLKSQRMAQEHEIAFYRRLARRDEQLVAEQRQQGLLAQEKEAAKELDKLEVRATVDGIIVAASRTPRPKLERVQEKLSGWHGTPLDAQNLGTHLEQRTHLCSIAPGREFEAILLVDQADRAEATPGRQVRLKIELLPGDVFTGTIERIADRHLEYAPPALTNKHGGPLPTVTDSTGREKLSSLAYQATVRLDEADSRLLRTGMRGKARFLVARRSLGEWIWRYLRNTFKFRL